LALVGALQSLRSLRRRLPWALGFMLQIAPYAQYVEWLRQRVHELPLPGTIRVKAAAACQAIAQEHHHSIILLIEHQLKASAFALIRPAFESYVRGEWLARCATDAEVESFAKNVDPPSIGALLIMLEAHPAFSQGVLSRIKRAHWNALCSYTHTGGLHVQRWVTSEAIESNYLPGEVLGAIQLAEMIATMSVIALANLADNEQLALEVLQEIKRRAKNDPSIATEADDV